MQKGRFWDAERKFSANYPKFKKGHNIYSDSNLKHAGHTLDNSGWLDKPPHYSISRFGHVAIYV